MIYEMKFLPEEFYLPESQEDEFVYDDNGNMVNVNLQNYPFFEEFRL